MSTAVVRTDAMGVPIPAGARHIVCNLPKPHGFQRKIKMSRAKRKVVCAGRRGGKTTICGEIAVEDMGLGRRVLLSSTTQDQADAFWEKVNLWLGPAIEAGVFYRNQTRRILALKSGMSVRHRIPKEFIETAHLEAELAGREIIDTGGSQKEKYKEEQNVFRAYNALGRVKVKTAHNADGLRGDYADKLVLDECARLAESAWNEVAAPMLLDNNGDAVLISTPIRRNWFYRLYKKGEEQAELVKAGALDIHKQRWESFHYSSFENPHLSREALAEIMQDMTEDAIREEIYALFLENAGAVFRNLANVTQTGVKAHVPADHAGHEIVLGGDWGQKNDWTVLSAFCCTCRLEVELDRFRQIAWSIQRDRIVAMMERWKVERALVESNSIGGPNLEALQELGLPVLGFETTAQSKGMAVRALALSCERADAKWLDIQIANDEMMAYEQVVNANGFATYSAPEGEHDDIVIARMLVLQAAYGARAAFSVGDASRPAASNSRPKGLAAVLQRATQEPEEHPAVTAAIQSVHQGRPVLCSFVDYFMHVREGLQAQAYRWAEQTPPDMVRFTIAMEEVKRLDAKYKVVGPGTDAPGGAGEGDGEGEKSVV
jgi:hypothetical protein